MVLVYMDLVPFHRFTWSQYKNTLQVWRLEYNHASSLTDGVTFQGSASPATQKDPPFHVLGKTGYLPMLGSRDLTLSSRIWPIHFSLSLLLSLDDVQRPRWPSVSEPENSLLISLCLFTAGGHRHSSPSAQDARPSLDYCFMCHEQVKAGLAWAGQISRSWKQPVLARITDPAASVFTFPAVKETLAAYFSQPLTSSWALQSTLP